MKYIICGFSGAGKSHLLKQLQTVKSLNSYTFIDLDDYILKNYAENHLSLGNFITQNGWKTFRKVEKKAISELLQQNNLVISLGGGTLTKELAQELECLLDVITYWLCTDFETCWNRIKEDPNRPLALKGKQECLTIFNERVKIFEKFDSINGFEDFLAKASRS